MYKNKILFLLTLHLIHLLAELQLQQARQDRLSKHGIQFVDQKEKTSTQLLIVSY